MINLLSKIAMLSKKGGAADVTPDSVDWNSVNGGSSPLTTNTQTITGISSSITLLIEQLYNDSDYSFEYKLNNGSWTTVSWTYSGGINSTTLEVNNNDTLAFRMTFSFGFSDSGLGIRIKNQSDNNTILDTFYFTIL